MRDNKVFITKEIIKMFTYVYTPVNTLRLCCIAKKLYLANIFVKQYLGITKYILASQQIYIWIYKLVFKASFKLDNFAQHCIIF